MKIALQSGVSEEEVQFIKQVGVEHVVWGGPESPDGYLDLDLLLRTREFFEGHGLQLGVIENVPTSFYDRVMLGLPGRDQQIDNYCRTLSNMGRAGIPVMGYNWMALGGISTDQVRGRGGALERRFDLDSARRAPTAALDWRGPSRQGRPIHLPDIEVSTEQMWDHLVYFLERVLPVAEEAGVRLAAHPDDAPIPSFLGVARILSSLDDLERLIDAVPSPSNGIDFCQGTISEMAGVDVVEAIRRFGARGKIFFAHFRDTQGTLPTFTEVFMDEGDTDMAAATRAYREVGFDGLLRADHTPHIVGDNGHAHRGFAFQVGYMKGLSQAAHAVQASAKSDRRAMGPGLALTTNGWNDEDLMFAQQLGATQVMAEAVLPDGDSPWDERALAALRNRVEKAGLGLAGMDRLPLPLDRTVLGETGRDGEIEAVCRFIEAAGAAAVPLVCYEWAPSCREPAPRRPAGRGGAWVDCVAPADVEAAPAASAQTWEHLGYFLERVLPVAERAGVRLAYRAGDGLAPLAGDAAALHTVEDLARLMDTAPSPCHGLDFRPSALAVAPGADAADAARSFASAGRVFLVTADNLSRLAATVTEAFLDEGEIDLLEVLEVCRECGYAGPLRPGRQPAMGPDTEGGHKGQALAAGYLRALLQAMEQGEPHG